VGTLFMWEQCAYVIAVLAYMVIHILS